MRKKERKKNSTTNNTRRPNETMNCCCCCWWLLWLAVLLSKVHTKCKVVEETNIIKMICQTTTEKVSRVQHCTTLVVSEQRASETTNQPTSSEGHETQKVFDTIRGHLQQLITVFDAPQHHRPVAYHFDKISLILLCSFSIYFLSKHICSKKFQLVAHCARVTVRFA